MFFKFSVEEDEPDEIITTNNYRANDSFDDEDEENDDTKELYHNGVDIPLSTIQTEPIKPRKKKKRSKISLRTKKKSINHFFSAPSIN